MKTHISERWPLGRITPSTLAGGKPESPKSGNAIFVVALVMAAISLVVGSLLQLGVQESQMNARRVVDMEGRNAVESAIEVATSFLHGRFSAETSLSNNNIPFTLSEAEAEAIKNPTKHVTDVSVESVTNVVTNQRLFIDPSDPENLNDQHRGKFITISEWEIVSSANVDFRGGERTIRASQTFQVREAPLFTHAIFYNMDLEFHPGPEMIISGPVHSNGDIWVVAKEALYFKDVVSATGGIKVGMMQQDYQLDWSAMPGENTQDGRKVWFNSGSDKGAKKNKIDGVDFFFNNLDADNGKAYNKAERYIDARSDSDTLASKGYTDFTDFLINLTSGMVLSGEDSAPRLLPMDMPPYKPDVVDDGVYNPSNPGYALIEPPATASSPSDPNSLNQLHKGAFETDKFGFKAGITFEIQHKPATVPANAIQLVAKGGSRANGDLTDYYIVPKRIKRGNPHNMRSADLEIKDVTNSDGDTVQVPQVQYEEIFIKPEAVDSFAQMRIYTESGEKPVDGIYDARRKRAHDLVSIDLGAFNEQVVGYKKDGDAYVYDPLVADNFTNFNPAQDYNGVVYVEFPTGTPDTSREDKLIVDKDAIDKVRKEKVGNSEADVAVALVLENASKIPDPAFNRNQAGRSEGFTLATNGMLYVKGHFNADGDPDTGSSTKADSGHDTVAALAADAITILSPSFDFSKSKDGGRGPQASFTEFNGAIITGLMPSNRDGKDGIGSGGSINLPRFLESWRKTEFRYRGSMVALFESEIANEPWSTAYYSPPIRDWGFFSRFGEGYQPPGTPVLRTYHKLDFRYLTAGL